ncbi:efflux RND transporter periplasmic adaptor subunit [bacterium]|nr:efflux RND transporter periplasmic adaptor subunit [bacterium]
MDTPSLKYRRRMAGCLIAAVLLVFGAAFGVSLAKFIKARFAPPEVLPPPPPPPVYVATPTNLVRFRSYTAELRAERTMTISAAVGEEIARLNVDVGSTVTQGQVIVELDPRYKAINEKEAAARLYLAVVTHSNAYLDLENNRRLLGTKVIGDEEFRRSLVAYHSSAATLDLARAAYERAWQELADCTISAPSAAKVSARFVERGERVTPNQPLLTLVDDRFLRLTFFPEDRDILCIRTNMAVAFTVDAVAAGTEAFAAMVQRIGADIENQTRLYRVEAGYDNAAGRLRAGMVARVNVPIEAFADTIFVPSYAVKRFGAEETVSLYEGGSNTVVRVHTGGEVEGWTEILDGVAPGDAVILR